MKVDINLFSEFGENFNNGYREPCQCIVCVAEHMYYWKEPKLEDWTLDVGDYDFDACLAHFIAILSIYYK